MMRNRLTTTLFLFVVAFGAYAETNKKTALHYAVKIDDAEYTESLVKKYKIDTLSADENGDTPLHIIAKNNSHHSFYPISNLVRSINVTNNYGETPVLIAAQNNSLEVAYVYMMIGADPNVKDNFGMDALDYAKNLESPLMYNILSNFSEENLNQELVARIRYLESLASSNSRTGEGDQSASSELIFYKNLLKEKNSEINRLKDLVDRNGNPVLELDPIVSGFEQGDVDSFIKDNSIEYTTNLAEIIKFAVSDRENEFISSVGGGIDIPEEISVPINRYETEAYYIASGMKDSPREDDESRVLFTLLFFDILTNSLIYADFIE